MNASANITVYRCAACRYCEGWDSEPQLAVVCPRCGASMQVHSDVVSQRVVLAYQAESIANEWRAGKVNPRRIWALPAIWALTRLLKVARPLPLVRLVIRSTRWCMR